MKTNTLNMATKSVLELIDIHTEKTTIVWEDEALIEAPNWINDNQFIVNSDGKMFCIDLALNQRKEIFTGSIQNCNNDHGLTPDGKTIFISSHDPNPNNPEAWKTSKIYKLPITGGIPELITKNDCSFWHGVSPGGKTILYTANRGGKWDIYSIPTDGGPEKQLTSGMGHKDGSEYSSDGKYIYYNSYESGSMEIWKMDANGNNGMALTNDIYSNWFPHPSPDGSNIVFLSYLENQKEDHPFGREVILKLMDLKTQKIKTIGKSFYGGQGTINVNSWSLCGSKFAYVRYIE